MPISEERRRTLMANNAEAKREARRCIKDALLALLEQNSYENIRMTDIIRKSGISRAGVYNNYKSKDEIILDIFKFPMREVFASLGNSVYDNLDMIFQIADKHRETSRMLIRAGLAHRFLEVLNSRYEDASVSFYHPVWNGLLYNAVIEWIKSCGDEPVEEALVRVKEGLKLLAESIETGDTNKTQNAVQEID